MQEKQRPEIFSRLGAYMPAKGDRDRWIEFISAIHDHVRELGLENDILFHGTSTKALESIMVEGMRPVDAQEALELDDIETIGELGSFWGTIETAAWFSEDTVHWRHENSQHAILAIPRAWLEANATIRPDLAMIKTPVFKASDDLQDEWLAEDCDMGWKECLRDWGAIVAIHDVCLDPSEISVINSLDDFYAIADMIIGSKRFSEKKEPALTVQG